MKRQMRELYRLNKDKVFDSGVAEIWSIRYLGNRPNDYAFLEAGYLKLLEAYEEQRKKNWQMKNKMSLWAVIVSAGVLMSAAAGDPFETSKQLEVFTAVLQQVQVNYVDEIGAEQAVGSAIKGMLKELDPYTVYYPEDKIEDVRLLQTGEYGGVGCVIQKIEKDIYISDLNSGLRKLREFRSEILSKR